MPLELAVGILDAHVPVEQAPEPEWAEVDVPHAVVDFLETDIFADTDGRDVDPAARAAAPG